MGSGAIHSQSAPCSAGKGRVNPQIELAEVKREGDILNETCFCFLC